MKKKKHFTEVYKKMRGSGSHSPLPRAATDSAISYFTERFAYLNYVIILYNFIFIKILISFFKIHYCFNYYFADVPFY